MQLSVLGYDLDCAGAWVDLDIRFCHPRRFGHLHGVISAPGEFQMVSSFFKSGSLQDRHYVSCCEDRSGSSSASEAGAKGGLVQTLKSIFHTHSTISDYL